MILRNIQISNKQIDSHNRTFLTNDFSGKLLNIRSCLIVLLIFGYYGNVNAQEPDQSPHNEMPFDCEKCHSTEKWTPVHFDHNETNFELTGQHQNVKCAQCHDLKDFANINDQCISCHSDIHREALGGDCSLCHKTQNWILFDIFDIHKNTETPIIGSHIQLDCENCHKTGQINDYRMLAIQCIDCHQNDYIITTNPNHSNFGFPENCQLCHQLLTWRPANWREHDDNYFPIFRGTHQGTWESCETCHTSGNFAEFNCLNCHAHSRSRMDSEHDEVGGYRYDSQYCYNCHPTGVGDD